MTIPNLHTAAVGAPLTRLGVSLFPVYLPGNKLPTITTGDTSGLLVDELETPSVRTLRVSNPTDKPVLARILHEGFDFVFRGVVWVSSEHFRKFGWRCG